MIPDLSGLRLRPDEESVGALSLKPWAMLCVDMHRTVQERIAEYEREPPKRGLDGSLVNKKDGREKRALNLKNAYSLQCAWMRLCYAPSDPHDNMKNTLDRNTQTTERLEPTEMEAFKESAKPEDLKVFNENMNRSQDTRNQTENSELTQPQFKALGIIREGKSTKKDQTLGDVIKTSASDNKPLYAEVTTKKFNNAMLSIEHIIPVSWLHATQAIDLFAYAGHDPFMVFACDTKCNSSRGNKALNFQGNPSFQETWPSGTDDDKLWSVEQKAFAARATIYGLLTYPLISPDGQVLKIEVSIPETGRHTNSVVPSTMERYNLQIDSMLEHMQRGPPPWEVALAGKLFKECGRINPLIVSKKAREAVADETHPLGAFLRQRLSSKSDALSRCLFAEFFRNVTR